MWKKVLEDTVEWVGANEFEVVIDLEKPTIAVCIECGDDSMLLIEAGIALGFCY